MKLKNGFIFSFFMLAQIICFTQNTKVIGRTNFEVIKLDLKNGKFISSRPLPFDVPFIIEGRLTKEIVEIQINYAEVKTTCKNYSQECQCTCDMNSPGMKKVCTWKRFYLSKDDLQDTFRITIPPLLPNNNYKFCVSVKRKYDSTELTRINKESKQQLREVIVEEFKTLKATNPQDVQSNITTAFLNRLSRIIDEEYVTLSTASFVKRSALNKISTVLDKDLNWEVLAAAMNRIRTRLINKDTEDARLVALWNNGADLKPILAGSKKRNPKYTLSEKLIHFLEKNENVRHVEEYKRALKGFDNLENPALAVDPGMTPLDSILIAQLILNQQSFASQLDDLADDLNNDGIHTYDAMLTNLLVQLRSSINEAIEIKNNLKIIDGQLKNVSVEKYLKALDILIPVSGFTTADFLTRADYYVTADLGLAYTFFDRHEIYPYAGVNFNFAPINRQATYRTRNFTHMKHPWWYVQSKKISMVLGVTFVSVKSEVNQIEMRKGIINSASTDRGLLTGIAYRLGDYGRFTVGTMLVKLRDQNLLVNKYAITPFPYFSLSLDLDIKDKLGDIADLIFN